MDNSKKDNKKTGNRGEDVACLYLEKQGYTIKERNYHRKWGEIDIIAMKHDVLHFVEVKSVIDKGIISGYRPEENVNNIKQRKLRRIIQTYLNENRLISDMNFEFHVITVTFDFLTRKSVIKMINNIIL